MRTYKVYGTTSFRSGIKGSQTREIVAARSKTEALRLFKEQGNGSSRDFIAETGNAIEVPMAMERRGRVLWKALDAQNGAWFLVAPDLDNPEKNRSVPYVPEAELTIAALKTGKELGEQLAIEMRKRTAVWKEDEQKRLRLIAAAPHLLSTLKQALQFLPFQVRVEAEKTIDYAENRRETP